MSINKINGVKKQDSFGPGVDNNNFIRAQDLNDVIDAVNTEIADVVSDVTNITPSYKIYRALLTQVGTAAPTAVVLENTVGTIVWTRVANGSYRGTLAGAFLADKVFSPGSVLNTTVDSSRLVLSIDRETNNSVLLTGYDVSNASSNLDGLLKTASIEILTFN